MSIRSGERKDVMIMFVQLGSVMGWRLAARDGAHEYCTTHESFSSTH